MPLSAGARLGPYAVTAQIGAGGMGEVYRARDTKLDRDVAIKVLPESLAADPNRIARFEREARMLASLNHPQIAQIHGLEESNGVRALVMELVEGPTLAEHIAGRAGPAGPAGLPLEEALPIARQIAEALEAAHEQGIVHRDLKPANIKVRPDGTVKVLDFGLAKAMDPAAGSSPSMSLSPTITSPAMMTGVGMILGTAAYMSPEQARGRTVDKRADIWAFGCVLFEMLSGTRPFDGDDITEVLGAVVRLEPNWAALPLEVTPPIRTLLQSCLVKDPRHRTTDIAVALFVLDNAASLAAPALASPVIAPVAAVGSLGRGAWIGSLAVATALIAAIAVPAVRHLRETPLASLPETRTDIVTPTTTDPISFALSPDGRQIVFVASGDRLPRLWLRSLAAATAQPLAGTEAAAFPFWSPDSRSVGFFADGRLKRLDIGGGTPQTLAAMPAFRGGTWNADGVILFSGSTGSPVFRVPASGGEPVAVTNLERHGSHRFPSFLPDGRRFLFLAQGAPDTAGIYVGSLDSAETWRVTPSDMPGAYLSSGWLLWVRAGTLVAQRLDLDRKTLTGDPITLADPVAVNANFGSSGVSVSAAGVVAYRPGGTDRRQLAWFDRSGEALGALGDPDENGLNSPRLSPDGRRVALFRSVQGNADIWVLDAARTTRFTFDTALDRYPIWSPDGAWIVFDSNRKGLRHLYRKSSSGAGAEELLLESTGSKVAFDWSRDGRLMPTRRSRSCRTGIPTRSDDPPGELKPVSYSGKAGSPPRVTGHIGERTV